MKSINKICFLLVLISISLFVLSSCDSYDATPEEYFTYIVTVDKTATITGYIGNEQSVRVPRKIKGHTVTAIGKNAFKDNDLIVTVTLPDSVTSIEDRAFYACSNLLIITMPKVTHIGRFAFFCVPD